MIKLVSVAPRGQAGGECGPLGDHRVIRPRISISEFMVLTVVCTLPMASLIVASDGWVDVTRYLTVAVLAAATYLASFPERRRGGMVVRVPRSLAGLSLHCSSIRLCGIPLATAKVSGMLPTPVVTLFMTAREIAETTAHWPTDRAVGKSFPDSPVFADPGRRGIGRACLLDCQPQARKSQGGMELAIRSLEGRRRGTGTPKIERLMVGRLTGPY